MSSDREKEGEPSDESTTDFHQGDGPIVVDWDGQDDKENIKRASLLRKIGIVFLLTTTAAQCTANSSVWSTASGGVQKEFDTSHEVIVAGISLYVWMLATGPLVVAPFSETFGRKPVYIVALLLYIAAQFMTAFGKNIETMLVGRAFTGLFGSVFLSNSPAGVGDVSNPQQFGIFVNINSIGTFMGPSIGPIIGSFSILQGWRWPFYIFLMWSGLMAGLVVLFLPETYAPMLKTKKAKRLRKDIGSERYRSDLELEGVDLWPKLKINLKRPFEMLIFEPMLFVLCFYSGFLLSVVYFFFVALPEIMQVVYGFSTQAVGLSFLGNSVGMLCTALLVPVFDRVRNKKLADNGGKSEPEFRLMAMVVGSVITPIGLFMFAWTIYPSIHWIVPIIASGIFGFGCCLTFNTIISYTVEAYQLYSASAVAANVFVRCMMAGAFPMFGLQMLYGMGGGFHWPMCFIAFIALLLMPSAFIILKYGKKLRSKSKFASASS